MSHSPALTCTPAADQNLWPVVSLLIRIVLGCTLLVSAIDKLQNPYAFLATIDQYELVGPRIAEAITIVLPFLEIMAGGCLIAGLALRATSILVVLLFALFVSALASVAYRGIHISCGCFGQLDASDVTWKTVARSAAFLTMSIIELILMWGFLGKRHRRDRLPTSGFRPSH
jgi:putative oxidoreductase